MSSQKTFKLVVLISGEGSNLQAIIDAITQGSLDASIELVISNRADANGLNRAQSHAIPIAISSPRKNQSRQQYDRGLIELIAPHQPNLIVLAGFMRILSAEFVQHFEGKIINIHPSLLPRYKGLNTHQRVLAAGEKYHGATVHYVNEALDDGELIIQSRIKITPDDNINTLQSRIHQEEHIIYPRAIQWLATRYNERRTH